MKTKANRERATVKAAPGILKSRVHRVMMAGGFAAVVRPIRPDDGPRLAEGLRRLSPESRRRRFLFSRGGFSVEELHYFTHCDGFNHLALVVVVTGSNGRENQFVAVARCIRDPADVDLAEVAIAVADDWQHHGIGEMLIQELARSSWEAGIRCWSATLFADNKAMRKLLELVGKKLSERSEDVGVVAVVYQLSRPDFASANCHEPVEDPPPKK